MESSHGAVSVQECSTLHLPQILGIYNYYVLETAVTFDTKTQDLSYIRSTYDLAKASGLPYLVAVSRPTDGDGVDTVIGYAYAVQFRARPAYAGTVQLSIYLDRFITGKGYGKMLLDALLQCLRDVPSTTDRPRGIREILAVSAIDPDNDVRTFYQKAGFVEVGHLSQVGWKFDKWWDTSYLQLSLHGEDE